MVLTRIIFASTLQAPLAQGGGAGTPPPQGSSGHDRKGRAVEEGHKMAATARPGEGAALRSNLVLLPPSQFPHQFKADLTQMPHKELFKLKHGPRQQAHLLLHCHVTS